MVRIYKLAILISSLSVSYAALAATTTTTMDIVASVAGSCSVTSSGADLGQVNPGNGDSASGTIDVNCSSGVNYNVALNAGLHVTDGGTVRSMDSGGDPIRYKILKGTLTGAPGTEWGDVGFANTFTAGTPVSSLGSGAVQSFGFSAQVVFEGSNTYTPGSSYSDTVTITVHF